MGTTAGYDKLVPEPTPHSARYWEGLNEHRLLLQQCPRCGKVRHYPQPMCPVCHSMEVAWIEASGRGTVHSWTMTHHAFHPGVRGDLPYLLATVDLEEGVRMNAQLRGVQPQRHAHRPAGARRLRDGEGGPDPALPRHGRRRLSRLG